MRRGKGLRQKLMIGTGRWERLEMAKKVMKTTVTQMDRLSKKIGMQNLRVYCQVKYPSEEAIHKK